MSVVKLGVISTNKQENLTVTSQPQLTHKQNESLSLLCSCHEGFAFDFFVVVVFERHTGSRTGTRHIKEDVSFGDHVIFEPPPYWGGGVCMFQ